MGNTYSLRCEVLQKINENAYRHHLISHLNTFDVFKVQHLSPIRLIIQVDLQEMSGFMGFSSFKSCWDHHKKFMRFC
jgi:hypothetical protein